MERSHRRLGFCRPGEEPQQWRPSTKMSLQCMPGNVSKTTRDPEVSGHRSTVAVELQSRAIIALLSCPMQKKKLYPNHYCFCYRCSSVSLMHLAQPLFSPQGSRTTSQGALSAAKKHNKGAKQRNSNQNRAVQTPPTPKRWDAPS